MLKESHRDYHEDRMVLERMPAAALQVIEPELVLHLLVRLLTAPPGLDGRTNVLSGVSGA